MQTPAAETSYERLNPPTGHNFAAFRGDGARRRPGWLFLLLALLFCGGCLAEVSCEGCNVDTGRTEAAATIRYMGSHEGFDIATWNIKWFGNRGMSPSYPKQLDHVVDVIRGSSVELWAIQEVSNVDEFNRLMAKLPEYDAILASDPDVQDNDGAYYVSEQRVGFIYRKDVVTVRSARVLFRDNDDAFGGRPPLEAEMLVKLGQRYHPLTFIVLHAKAGADHDAISRRELGAKLIKDSVDKRLNKEPFVILGDFNDDLDVSINKRYPSPYGSMVRDSDYLAASYVLTEDNTRTSTGGSDALDHVVLAGGARGMYRINSLAVERLDYMIDNYKNEVSDHFPVHFSVTAPPFGAGLPTLPASNKTYATAAEARDGMMINEVLANEPALQTSAEFVELYNGSRKWVRLGGWTISDSLSVRHEFPVGTELAPGKAIVVTGGAFVMTGESASQAASEGSLGLNNGADTVTVLDGSGNLADEVSFDDQPYDGVSMTRERDGDASTDFMWHSSMSASYHSAGQRIDLSDF